MCDTTCLSNSKHSLDEFVDLLLSVAESTAVMIRMSLFFKSLLGRVKLERPEEVVCLLEMSTNGGNLVDEILSADDTVLSEFTCNDGVVRKRNSVAVNLSIASLVDELFNSWS